jgi:hypothetical protein
MSVLIGFERLLFQPTVIYWNPLALIDLKEGVNDVIGSTPEV